MRKTVLALLVAIAAPAFAVVPSTTSRVDTTGNGSTTAFTFTFPVTTSSSHVEVFLAGVKQTSGYTVTLNANQSSSPGGTVTFTTAPANAVAVRIQRTVPLTQETVYTPYSAFPAKTTEKALDRGVYQAQQGDRRVADAEATHAADKATQASRDAAQDAALAQGAVGGNDTFITATGTSRANTLATRAAREVWVTDFTGIDPTGATSSTAAIQAAQTLATSGGAALRFPKGTFRIDAGLVLSGNVVGDGPDQTIFDAYGVGTAIAWSGGQGAHIEGFTLRSKSAGQSGLVVPSGTGVGVRRIRILDFDGVGFRLGVAGTSGVYFADVDYIECNNTTTAGTTAFVIDGGVLPNSNANVARNVFVKGKWATLYDVRGNKNVIVGGDAEMNNSAAAITEAYKVSGIGNQFVGPYIEQMGATFPAVLVNFMSTAQSNRFQDVYLAAAGAGVLTDHVVVDAGTANDFAINPNGYNFASGARNVSYTNLVPNSGFRTVVASTGLPVGWIASLGAAFIATDSSTLRGASHSVRMNVTNDRAALASWLATGNIAARQPLVTVPVAALRGRTMMVGAWAKSSTAGCGAVKLYAGSLSYGTAKHPGTGDWKLLTASGRIDDAATEVAIELRTHTDNSNSTCDVYFSEPFVVIGNELPQHAFRPVTDDAAVMAGPLVWSPPVAFADLATTPSVADGNVFLPTNTNPTTISNFTGGWSGQEITLIPADGNTTIANNSNIATTTGANKGLTSGQVYRFINDGTKWREIGPPNLGGIFRGATTGDVASIAAQTCTNVAITVTGAVTGAECAAGPPSALPAGLSASCYVSAAGTAQVRLCNVTAGAIDPASLTYSARVFNP